MRRFNCRSGAHDRIHGPQLQLKRGRSFQRGERPEKSHRKLTATIAVSLALLATTSLAGCSAWAGSRQGYLVYDDKNEAVGAGDKDVPAWLPDDATGITLDYPADAPGYLMKFASAAGVPVSATCAAVPQSEPLKPRSRPTGGRSSR